MNATKLKLKDLYNTAINEVKSYPVSFAVTGASLCLSTAVWTKCIDLSGLPHKMPPKNITESVKMFLNLLLIRKFDGYALLNILSLYKTMRDLEFRSGSKSTLELFWLNAALSFVYSVIFDQILDFNFFSRSLTAISCFSNPEAEVLFYGLFKTKNKYLLVYLLLSDYLLTLNFQNFLDGLYAISQGSGSLLLYRFLRRKK